MLTNYGNFEAYYEALPKGPADPITGYNPDMMARVTARFQCLADARQLEVTRYSGYIGNQYGRQGAHDVLILDQDGEVVANVGGYVSQMDIECGGNWYKRFVEETEVIDRNYIRIPLMLAAEPLPDLPDFWDENGQPFDLSDDFEGDTKFVIMIDIRREDVTDEFHEQPLYVREKESRDRTIARCNIIKEQLMIHCWRPERVQHLLEAGYDIEDM
jgi:hypothetical protein